MLPKRPNRLAKSMLRVKGRESSAVAVSDENLFKILPAQATVTLTPLPVEQLLHSNDDMANKQR